MKRTNSISKNFLYNSILTSSNFIFPLLIYPYVSRVLGVEKIGVCEFTDSIINYFMLFSMMGINILGTREIAKVRDNKERLSEVFSSLFLLNLITTLAALFILLAAVLLVPQLQENLDLMCIGAFKVIFNFLLINWFYQGLEEFRYITLRSVFVKIAYLIAIFLCVKNQEDYGIYYLLSTLMFAGNAIINLIHSKKYIHLSFHFHVDKHGLKSYLYLGVYLILCSMYTTFNVTFLGFSCGNVQVGFYSTAYKIFTIALAFFSAFTTVALPRLSHYIVEGHIEKYKEMLNKTTELLFLVSIPMIAFFMINAKETIWLIAGQGYEGAIIPMMIIMPVMFVVGYEQILVIQGLMPINKDKAVLFNSSIGCLVGISLNMIFVEEYGAVGSAAVWLCAEICVLVCAQYFMKKYVGLGFPFLKLAKSISLYVPLFALLMGFHLILDNSWYKLILSGIGTIVYFLLLNIYITKNNILLTLISKNEYKRLYRTEE